MESLVSDHSEEGLDAYQFVFGSQRVTASRELADYARDAFPAGRPLLEAILDLMRKIHRDFRFDTKATEVTTPVAGVLPKAPRRMPGLRSSANCLHAIAGPAGPLYQRLSANAATAWPAAFSGRRRVTCLVFGVVPRRRVGRFRSHEQLRAQGRPHHSGVGARL